MSRTSRTWITFGLCFAVVLGVMAWLSVSLIELERNARQEASVRLALWRLDSKLKDFLFRENARDGKAYTTLYYELEGRSCSPERKLSPIFTAPDPWVLLYFMVEADGNASSPQSPSESDLSMISEEFGFDGYAVSSAVDALEQFREVFDLGHLATACSVDTDIQMPSSDNGAGFLPPRSERIKSTDYMLRKSALAGDAQEPLRPEWIGEDLLLTRVVTLDGSWVTQGCWLNWDDVRRTLLAEVADLLPEAQIEPVDDSAPLDANGLLAGLPVRLIPGPRMDMASTGLSPYSVALLIGWACLVIAATTVAALLRATLRLSERRGAFVSAVTHELRTPLTTFKMYTEMLAENMVTDPARRQRYLDTLRTEAHRLGHLVENVLSYARLDQGRSRFKSECVALNDVLERTNQRLVERADQTDMSLIVTPAEDATLQVCTDVAATEQILFNLVDNACKYASSAPDRRIHLEAFRQNGAAALRIRDHGPGVSSDVQDRLFQPFSKSEVEAANSAPGVGLGLSLCRRLARDMGGDLVLESNAAGASFLLTLPGTPSI
jgi:signal transduction histidine kinase